MKKINRYLMFLTICFTGLLMGCTVPKNAPTTAATVDVKRYMGKWYEIASFPNHFQKGCRCTTAQYSLLENNKISVVNRCVRGGKNEISVAHGTAWAPNSRDFSKLKVQFFWPFSGNYWILFLVPDYSAVLVGSPNYKYLWILSRTPQLDTATYEKLLSVAQQKGYNILNLRKTLQNCKIVTSTTEK